MGRRITDPRIYPHLPDVLKDDPEWAARAGDLVFMRELVPNQPVLRILDIGAWNGWLSYHLAKSGHRVAAVDYFIDEFDGLAAVKHYPEDWFPIQMDLEDLELIRTRFDLVILNRCVQFFTDPIELVRDAMALVRTGGRLVITGLAFFRDSRSKKSDMELLETEYGSLGLSFFKPVRGYLDMSDREQLQALNITLHAPAVQKLKNLSSRLVPTRPELYYGIWRSASG